MSSFKTTGRKSGRGSAISTLTTATAMAMVAVSSGLAQSPAANATAASERAWTWSLYEDSGTVVLANDIPDTPDLKATLECEGASGAVRLTLYDSALTAGYAQIGSGRMMAASEATAGRNGALNLAIRSEHPVFRGFVRSGRLPIAVNDKDHLVMVPSAYLPKLRQFAEQCAQ